MLSDSRSAYVVIFGAILLLLAFCSLFVFEQNNVHEAYLDVTDRSLSFVEGTGQKLTPEQALESKEWLQSTKERLASPRRHSVLWLKVALEVRDDQSLDRMLEIAPWRVGNIDVYQLDESSSRILGHWSAGPSIPLTKRPVYSRRNLLSIETLEGAAQNLLVRVESDSRPTLSLRVWGLRAVLAQDNIEQAQHAALFGCVIALVALLLLRLDWISLVLAIWLSSAFIMQAEQVGYISFQLFGGLREHGLAIRMTSWQISLISFFVSSFFLLDRSRRKIWCLFYALTVSLSALLILGQGLISDNAVRVLSSYFSLCVLLVWPFSLSNRALPGDPYRQMLLVLFVFSWVESIWFCLDYIFGIYYGGAFSVLSVLVRLGIIIGIVGIFTVRQQVRRRQVEHELLEGQRQQNIRLEKAVAQRTRELQAAVVEANNAIQTKVDFLGRVSHDLRSPLTSIIGYAQLLQAEGGTITRKAGVIYRSANHMLALVSDLIDYAKGSSGQTLCVAPTYIHGLLDSVVLEAQVLAQRNHNKFSFDLLGQLPAVLNLDAKRLRQVLINLLDNAAKFTRDGVVGLRVYSIGSPNEGDCVDLYFCVHDTGIGISEEDLPSLFSPFFRGHPLEIEGSGLGLSIVEHWVGLMGGEIGIESDVGKGTCVSFHVTLSVASEDEIAEPQLFDFSIAAPPLNGGGRRIWIVEDNEDIRNLLLDELENCEFKVETASDGQDCLERLVGEAGEPPSLVLTDYLMPRLNGGQLLFALRARWPSLPIVLISATEQTMQSLTGPLKHEFDAVLVKPINFTSLRMILAQLLGIVYGLGMSVHELNGEYETVLHQLRELDGEYLNELKGFLESGAVTDVFEWLDRLPLGRFELKGHIRSLAEACDLDSISDLLGILEKGDF
ncbi:ATP-binding protein [Pseudomonas sp. GZD-209]|uniref:hybrid sensor histidine kinase/response regulator n=1 Tax=Pseudomonas sp. GZD-209 TaxID=3404807 RepID=UPI003BB626A1